MDICQILLILLIVLTAILLYRRLEIIFGMLLTAISTLRDNKITGGQDADILTDVMQTDLHTDIIPNADYAYVTLVMKGDAYIPGALVTAASIKNSGSKYPTVCMITHDVSEEAKTALEIVFDEVVTVPYITHECLPMKTKKQDGMYGSWADNGFTKWNALNLTKYKKVLFVDADQIVLSNIDSLFDMSTPAGTFSSPWAAGKYNIPNIYGKLNHGDKVDCDTITKALNNGSIVEIAAMVLLSPSVEDYNGFLSMLANWEGPFGFDSYSMYDEQSIAWYYCTKKQPWYYLHQRYNYILWHTQWLEPGDTPYTLHYFGSEDKPWKISRNKWPDLEVWWTLANLIITKYGSKPFEKIFNMSYINMQPNKICAYCQVLKKTHDHHLMDTDGKITCRLLKKNIY